MKLFFFYFVSTCKEKLINLTCFFNQWIAKEENKVSFTESIAKFFRIQFIIGLSSQNPLDNF